MLTYFKRNALRYFFACETIYLNGGSGGVNAYLVFSSLLLVQAPFQTKEEHGLEQDGTAYESCAHP